MMTRKGRQHLVSWHERCDPTAAMKLQKLVVLVGLLILVSFTGVRGWSMSPGGPGRCSGLFQSVPASARLNLFAASLPELERALTASQKMRLTDYLDLAEATGEVGYLSDARTARLLLTTSETIGKHMQEAVDAGLQAFGLIVSIQDANEMWQSGSLKIFRGDFIPLTQAQVGLRVPQELLKDDEVMFVVAVAMIDNIQALPVDVSKGNTFGRRSVLTDDNRPTLKSITEYRRLMPSFDGFGRYSMISTYKTIPIWAIKQIVVNQAAAQQLRKESASGIASTTLSETVQDFQRPLPFAKVPMRRRMTAQISQRVSLLDPFSIEEMTQTVFRHIVRSSYLGDWLHLIGSRIELQWANRRHAGKVLGRLISVHQETSVVQGAGLHFSILSDDGRTYYISQSEVTNYLLEEYVPNGPRAGKVAVKRALLEANDVQEFLLAAPKLEFDLTVIP